MSAYLEIKLGSRREKFGKGSSSMLPISPLINLLELQEESYCSEEEEIQPSRIVKS